MGWVYLKGKFIPEEQATLSIFDRGFLYGDGIFETLRAYRGRPYLLSRHLERLRGAAGLVRLPLPGEIDCLELIIEELIRLNSLDQVDSVIRITLSRGIDRWGIAPSGPAEPTLLITVKGLDPWLGWWQDRGIEVVLLNQPRARILANIQLKSLNALDLVLGSIEVQEREAKEGIFVDPKGCLLEGTRTNIFLIRGATLYTPPPSLPILPGITRGVVMELAQDLGYPLKEEAFRVEEALAAQEIFLTNSVMEIVPVIRIDSHLINLGRVGLITRRLQKAYKSRVDGTDG